MGRDFEVLDANTLCLTIWGLDETTFGEAQRAGQANILWQLFDTKSSVHPLFNPTRVIEGNEAFQTRARSMIASFKMTNALAEQEPWYDDICKRLSALDGFAELWASVQTGIQPDRWVEGERIFHYHLAEGEVALRVYRLTVVDIDFPQIVIYFPVGEDVRRI